ncbi:MAG: hemin storage protein [Pseudomonadota bacterium]|jgi:biofilm PGA synthesis lipoprotein PgaB
MARWLAYCVGFIGCLFAASIQAANNEVQVLCYHDVVEDIYAHPDTHSVDVTQLVTQFSWMRENGYQPVSLSDIIAAREGKKALPEKAVLLTFDDGYVSFYEKIYPLLREFNYPAVLALVGEWMDAPPDGRVIYDGKPVPRANFVSWDQVRKMSRSGLIEIASHTYALHKGVAANPQGNLQPAAVSRIYDKASASYESDDAYTARIRADMTRNVALIEKETGVRPRAMVWPYGKDNLVLRQTAEASGMPIAMTLQEGKLDTSKSLNAIPRKLIRLNPLLPEFADILRDPGSAGLTRVMHVDLDYIYDTNIAQQDKNLGALLERILAMGVNTVYLQAFADDKGDGNARSLYFPNRHMPVRADLFNRVAWQIAQRTGAKVFAWMPVLAFDLPKQHPAASIITKALRNEDKQGYKRLSLFSPVTRSLIGDLYEDLAKNAFIDGILFHDDATLNEYEDASPEALEYYAKNWTLPKDVNAIRADPKLMAQWTANKTRELTSFTVELADRVKKYRPHIKTARNLYASVITEPASEAWLAQSLPSFLQTYDWVAVMAMPYMEKAANPGQWLDNLVRTVAQTPGALKKTVFELQSMDWEKKTPLSAQRLYQDMRRLQLSGALNFGYYPDDFVRNFPDVDVIAPALSLRDYPRP